MLDSIPATSVATDASLATEPRVAGLGGLVALAEGRERPFPLQSVRVRCVCVGDCSRTVVRQIFVNDHESPLEAVYLFPLPANGAVTEMWLRAGEVEVRAECRDRDSAQAAFAAARAAGHRAGLLTAERADVYTLRATNIPPRTEVAVDVVVVERLEAIDGTYRWRFPTVIPPRYLPGEPIGQSGAGVLPDTDRVGDASRLQPPLRLEGGTALDLEVEIQGAVSHLASSLHAVGFWLGADGAAGGPDTRRRGAVTRVAPSASATLDRDFVIAFSYADAEEPRSRAWTDGAYTLVIVEPPAEPPLGGLGRDAAFVIDVSGSMSGPKLAAAKRALSSALHGLDGGDRFMLLAFDNEIVRFGDAFHEVDDGSLARADQWIADLEARGGTEMLPAVAAALAADTPDGRLRTVLLITDGEVWNESELVAAVGMRAPATSLFTMGIDTAVNEHLLQRLARIGGGTCELCAPGDDIEAAVLRLETRFGSPLARDVRVEGGEPARAEPGVLYAGRPIGLLLAGAPGAVRLSATTPGGRRVFEVPCAPTDFALGPLWARERIAALEDRIALPGGDEQSLRREIVELALQHGLTSRYTAMVAVDRSAVSEGSPLEVVQPVELPLDWDDSFRLMGDSAPRASAALRCSAAGFAAPLQLNMQSARTRLGLPAGLRGGAATTGAPQRPVSPPPDAIGMPQRPACPPPDAIGDMCRRQGADGSFGADKLRTAAALVALVLAGHTQRSGLRRRTVRKAARWLGAQPPDVAVALALELLARAEAGVVASELVGAAGERLEQLCAAGPEGAVLADTRRRVAAQGADPVPGPCG